MAEGEWVRANMKSQRLVHSHSDLCSGGVGSWLTQARLSQPNRQTRSFASSQHDTICSRTQGFSCLELSGSSGKGEWNHAARAVGLLSCPLRQTKPLSDPVGQLASTAIPSSPVQAVPKSLETSEAVQRIPDLELAANPC